MNPQHVHVGSGDRRSPRHTRCTRGLAPILCVLFWRGETPHAPLREERNTRESAMMCSHDTFRSLGSAAPFPGPDGPCQNGLSQSAAMHLERMNTNDGSRNNKTNTLSTTMNMTWEQNSHLSMWMIDSFPERSTNVHMWLIHCTSPANSPIAPACWQIFRTHVIADDWSSTLLRLKEKPNGWARKSNLEEESKREDCLP